MVESSVAQIDAPHDTMRLLFTVTVELSPRSKGLKLLGRMMKRRQGMEEELAETAALPGWVVRCLGVPVLLRLNPRAGSVETTVETLTVKCMKR